jgi:phenylacetate-coenzyme A ligase PaaK-like adenylate-forming protein
METVKENIAFHEKNCAGYAAILKAQGFDPARLSSEDDLYKIPVIPTLYFKRNRLFSIADDKMVIHATSSGTKGLQSRVCFDRKSLNYGVVMMYRFFSYHHVVSLMPTNYIVLNYPPRDSDNTGAVQTAYGTTKFAPALHREYALKHNEEDGALNFYGVQKALIRYAKQGFPVRFVGFPAYMYFLAGILKEKGISLRLNKNSKILLGGGWKQFEEIDREDFYARIEETLGLRKENCLEFFSAAEHPLPYCKCENGNFHVPIYSHVIVRDVKTLLPLKNGEEGLLNFISPLVWSMPLTSVLTDDLGVLHDGAECACGIGTPYFELRGRANVRQIKTCATAASELLGGMEK